VTAPTAHARPAPLRDRRATSATHTLFEAVRLHINHDRDFLRVLARVFVSKFYVFFRPYWNDASRTLRVFFWLQVLGQQQRHSHVTLFV